MHDALRRWRDEAAHRVFDTGRYRMRYADWGDGPTIVWVHGLCDQAVSFAPAAAHLVPGYRHLIYELPEGGRDGANLRDYPHAAFADDLLSLLDHLKIERAVAFGSSFGSTVVLRALAAHPVRLPVGILQGGFAYRPLHPLERLLARACRGLPGRMRTVPFDGLVRHFNDRPTFEHGPREAWTLFRETSGQTRAQAVVHRALLLAETDLRPLLPSIRQPVLMIGGSGDTTIPREVESTAEDGLPNVRRVEFPRLGHFPQYLDPAGTAREMRDFLRTHGWGN